MSGERRAAYLAEQLLATAVPILTDKPEEDRVENSTPQLLNPQDKTLLKRLTDAAAALRALPSDDPARALLNSLERPKQAGWIESALYSLRPALDAEQAGREQHEKIARFCQQVDMLFNLAPRTNLDTPPRLSAAAANACRALVSELKNQIYPQHLSFQKNKSNAAAAAAQKLSTLTPLLEASAISMLDLLILTMSHESLNAGQCLRLLQPWLTALNEIKERAACIPELQNVDRKAKHTLKDKCPRELQELLHDTLELAHENRQKQKEQQERTSSIVTWGLTYLVYFADVLAYAQRFQSAVAVKTAYQDEREEASNAWHNTFHPYTPKENQAQMAERLKLNWLQSQASRPSSALLNEVDGYTKELARVTLAADRQAHQEQVLVPKEVYRGLAFPHFSAETDGVAPAAQQVQRAHQH
ncbi:MULTISPECIES: hypothetical protein [unclassified Undibacterium]|nr:MULTISPECIES: hypothetical protein [unclassified Undibacterium]MEB0138574.1 hypothetical protein [Undibacterium sp. CCC2.1]MEB0171362.1 hypothetical protein [Undibacterium sp. CCC1.1]MEB0175338.1 hypothetical protein [Undibacterium sp. CCC3.4]MEB0214558.1 hypothetical protein [Undibacterium sp. 5I2]WPX43067.1 hypothetical protein RHM61_17055 [Undibacterium sp. CCC3.4]